MALHGKERLLGRSLDRFYLPILKKQAGSFIKKMALYPYWKRIHLLHSGSPYGEIAIAFVRRFTREYRFDQAIGRNGPEDGDLKDNTFHGNKQQIHGTSHIL